MESSTHHSSAAVPQPERHGPGVEARQEQLLVRACLAGLCCWPLVWMMTPRVQPLASFHVVALLGGLVASVPLPIVVHAVLALVTRGRRALWVVDPAQALSASSHLSMGDAVERVKGRVAAMGLNVERTTHEEGRTQLFFGRPRTGAAATFLDHGFAGQALFTPEGTGCSVTMRITFLDTLLVDTSEGERMKELLEYLLSQRADFDRRSTMLTLHGGVHLAVLATLLALLAPWFPVPPDVVGSLAAAGAMVLAADLVVGRTVAALGVRAALAGLALCAAPWLAEAVRLVALL